MIGIGSGRTVTSSSNYSSSSSPATQYTTMDYQSKPMGAGMQGEVTMRTTREEERTMSKAAPSQSVYTRLTSPSKKATSSSSSTVKSSSSSTTKSKTTGGAWR